MKPLSSTLHHLVIPPRTAGTVPPPLLVLMHGRGADEHDLAGLADDLDGRFFLLSVRAPFPFGAGGGYTWYDFSTAGTPEPGRFGESYDRLRQFLDDAAAGYPVDPERVFLLGFSMGSVMAHAAALMAPERVRGIVANSGYVPEGTALSFRWEALAGLDVLITHGTWDPVLPVAMGRRARDLYASSAARLDYREYPMGHQITPESLEAVDAWLTRSLDGPPSLSGHG